MSRSSVLVAALLLVAAQAHAAFPHPATGKNGMVSSAHPLASQAGVDIMKLGGNAVDAACAVALVVSVVEPFSAGLGGGGFAVVSMEGKGQDGAAAVTALDFRERAPAKATGTMYQDAQGKVVPGLSTDGHLAVAVPGTVAGLAALHGKHGKLPWSKVVQPAIKVAQQGFAVGWRWTGQWADRQDVLAKQVEATRVFTKRGVPLVVGEVLKQPDLAKTLTDLAKDPKSFYGGRVGKAIAADMAANGGLITLDDLKAYQPVWREPVCGTWRGDRLCSMPPPSSGGVHILQILNLMGEGIFDGKGWHDADAIHRSVEAMRIAYADRAKLLGDPAFVDVPVAGLTSAAYAAERSKEIDEKRARRSVDVQAGDRARLKALRKEPSHTSHLVVVDKDRNAVSLTFTVNTQFGSCVVAKGTGVLLNNEMDDFSAAPDVPNTYGLIGGEANSIQAGKVPLSSMTPLIVWRGGKFFLAAGGAGGSRIITSVLQVYLNAAVHGMDAAAAVAAPRFHHQWLPDEILVERYGFDVATTTALIAKGHAVRVVDGMAVTNAVRQDETGTLEGGADPRAEGRPFGY